MIPAVQPFVGEFQLSDKLIAVEEEACGFGQEFYEQVIEAVKSVALEFLEVLVVGSGRGIDGFWTDDIRRRKDLIQGGVELPLGLQDCLELRARF